MIDGSWFRQTRVDRSRHLRIALMIANTSARFRVQREADLVTLFSAKSCMKEACIEGLFCPVVMPKALILEEKNLVLYQSK
jgi:hypothetical protein